MAEEADKLGIENTEARVLRLRAQIASKRDEIDAEIGELRRRRKAAFVRGRKVGQVLSLSAVGILILGSLSKAVFDIFAHDDQKSQTTESKSTGSSPISGLMAIAFFGIRWAAKEWVRLRLVEVRERHRSDRRWEKTYGNGNGSA